MKILYRKGSIAGTNISREYNHSFVVDIFDVVEKTSSGKGWIHPMLEQDNDADVVGRPDICISLPNIGDPRELELVVSVPNETLGCFEMRKITKDEIKALRKAWPIIRKDLIDDAYSVGKDLEPLLDQIDDLMVVQQIRIYTPDPVYTNPQRIAFIGTPPPVITSQTSSQNTTHPESDPKDQKAHAVTYDYDERGRYYSEPPEILLLTDEEKNHLVAGVVTEVNDTEELEELTGKFYQDAELLYRAKKRQVPAFPLTIHGCVFIWLN